MTAEPYEFRSWFLTNWSRTTVPMAAILLIFGPLLLGHDPLRLLIYLQIPMYMIHQYEEHAHGRFKEWVTREVGGGQEALTDGDLLFINVVLVWALQISCLVAAVLVQPAWGLLGAYMPLVNGISHIAATVKTRAANPGVWTSIFLFLPVAGFTVWYFASSGASTWEHHVVGLVLCLAGHAVVLGMVAANRMRAKNLGQPGLTS